MANAPTVGSTNPETGCRLRRSGARIGVTTLLLLAALLAPTTTRAAEPSTLTLGDGSTITGEVVSLVGGIYTVRSPTLGTLTVKASDVRSLTNGGANPKDIPAPPPAPPQLDSLQEQIANDPETMKAIMALQDDPELMAILEDPEVMGALESGDLNALLANPKLGRLADDPKVQDITRRFAK